MVDRVPATSRRASLERAELRDQLRVVEKLHGLGVDRWEQLPVEVALRLLSGL
jgi:hypothetical protein